ncbi:hypothetical protein H257_03643 [Aphanomyces astaci]|uniref:Uncharacterized protein n=1 Tax=Aphanomyces astaci TaxID=112090 RepID=W4GXM1_APHAT|nr:hypothetical protein H257_03643 [Aphanomyces astaci]ETV84432.1 hypothetical protein H257_03643 [Aphanomyces astaci]RQM31432.1 hypothetical protein B5M09_001265 [Aphanomyces astaci]|eukprot:XP_009826124.1 hypothetical protein H257_03643 [Aphanomyces astaci]
MNEPVAGYIEIKSRFLPTDLKLGYAPTPSHGMCLASGLDRKVMNVTHWYDGVTLFLRLWMSWFTVDLHTRRPMIGRKNVRPAAIKATTAVCMPASAPTLIGECGVPFNILNDGAAYAIGDFFNCR